MAEVFEHSGHDLVLAWLDVDLGGGEMGVAEDPLDVGQCQLRVGDHPLGGGAAELVQRPGRAQPVVGTLERPAHGRIVQRPMGRPSGEPQRRLPVGPGLAALVEPKPDESIGRRREPLQPATALAGDGDELAAHVDVVDG